jgi:hypothetical protein
MVSDFKTAKKTLRTSNSKLNIVAVNGCCYGRDNQTLRVLFFANSQNILKFFTNRKNGTFGYAQTQANLSQNPKSHFFCRPIQNYLIFIC